MALQSTHRHILIPVILDTLGGRVSLLPSTARQRLLRCHRMINSPPLVQASGGLLIFAGQSARVHSSVTSAIVVRPCTSGHVTQDQCNFIAFQLDSRPRKTLGFKTPAEIYYPS